MAWAVIEDESALKIAHKTGGLTRALKEDRRYQPLIEDYAGSMAGLGIPFDRLNAAEVMHRFPQWRLDEEVDAIYQPDMGLVDAVRGNAAHLAIARYRGATFIENCPATEIRPFEDGVELETPRGRFTCRRLIVTSGGWTDKLLAKINYAMPRDRGFVVDRLPGYPHISVFVGAGHGYKFAALFGKILSELAIDGQTHHPIQAFAVDRPAITDPNFPPSLHT